MFSRFTVTREKNGYSLEVEGEEKVEGKDETSWYQDTYVFTTVPKLVKALKIVLTDKGN